MSVGIRTSRFISKCQLFLLVQRCSSPVDNVWTLAPVISMRPLSKITATAQRVADANERFRNSKSVTVDRCWQFAH